MAQQWFTPAQADAVADMWRVFHACSDELSAAVLRFRQRDPVFAGASRDISEDDYHRQTRESRERLARAMVSNDWSEHVGYLHTLGTAFGRAGVPFASWQALVRSYGQVMIPRLVEAYSAEPARLGPALLAFEEFIARSLDTIAGTYFDAREAALRASEQNLAVTLDSIGDGVLVTDLEGRIVRMNPIAVALSGWTAAEARGHPIDEVLRLASEDSGAIVEAPIARVLRDGVVVGLANHTELIARDGSRRPIADSAAPIRDPDGALLGVVMVFRDMTHERQEQQQRDQLQRHAAKLEEENLRAREASRLKSEFLANMSHELRTPLNAILGFAELLHDGMIGAIAPRQQECLGDILAGGHHLLRLINDILDLSKVEAGKIEFRPIAADLQLVLAEAVAVLRPTAERKGVTIELDVDHDAREVIVDVPRLQQIIYNYLSNALKFTAPATTVQVRARADGDATFRIEVQDHGIGIAADDLSRLFIDFQQLDAGTGKQHGGTGLGLALTKRLVEAQGGSVGVTSTPGQGSTFYAVLPRRSVGRQPMPAPRSFAASSAGAATVLLAEGDAGHQAIIARSLIGAGYAVETVATAAQALERCRGRRFDAIAVGVSLPDLSGFELARRLHNEHRGDITLLVTVVDDSAAGFVIDDVLPRAIDAATVLASLREAGAGSGPVLIIDDDPGSRRLMRETLAQVGYDAILEADATRALEIVEQAAPAAIVLDLLMPGMDGFEFLARLRADPASAALPVLVWTAKDLSRAELDRLRERAQAVVGKSSAIAELVAALRAVVPSTGAPRTA